MQSKGIHVNNFRGVFSKEDILVRRAESSITIDDQIKAGLRLIALLEKCALGQ